MTYSNISSTTDGSLESAVDNHIETLIPITPNAEFLDVASDAGYTSIGAIADLIDNCTDAFATMINLLLRERGGKPQTILADNGIGMNKKVASGCLVMGATDYDLGDARKIGNAVSGRFGSGMNFAIAYFKGRAVILTLNKEDGTMWKLIYDSNEIKARYNSKLNGGERPQWEISLVAADASDIETFKEYVGKDAEQGTVVMIENIEGCNLHPLKGNLPYELGRKFGRYIDAGIKLTFNKKTIRAIDPLYLNHVPSDVKKSEVIRRKKITGISYIDRITGEMKHDGWIQYTAVVGDLTAHRKIAERLKWNLYHQGITVMRNNREIQHGSWYGMMPKGGAFNRFFVTIEFPPCLDDAWKLPFNKMSVSPFQNITDIIRPLLKQDKDIYYRKLKEYRKGIQKEQSDSDKNWLKDFVTSIGSLTSLFPKLPPTDDKTRDERREPALPRTRKGDGLSVPQPYKTGKDASFEIRLFSGEPNGKAFQGEVGHVDGKEILWLNSEHSLYLDYFRDANFAQKSVVVSMLLSYIKSKYHNSPNDDFLIVCENVENQMGRMLSLFLGKRPGLDSNTDEASDLAKDVFGDDEEEN